MKGKNLTIDQCIGSLERKNVLFDHKKKLKTADISGAMHLGNGSWGMLDFLKRQGYFITGFYSYARKMERNFTAKNNNR